MQSKIMKLSLIVLVFVFSAITIGITSVEAIWPFDQMFSPQSPPQNNQSNRLKPIIWFTCRSTTILKISILDTVTIFDSYS